MFSFIFFSVSCLNISSIVMLPLRSASIFRKIRSNFGISSRICSWRWTFSTSLSISVELSVPSTSIAVTKFRSAIPTRKQMLTK